LLIETGPWPAANPDPPLVRLNFVAIVRALSALADGSVHRADPARYDSLPENDSLGFYYLIRNVTLRVSRTVPPFVGDLGISATRRVRVVEGSRRLFLTFSVNDLGDLRTHAGLFEIDGTGKILAPLAAGAEQGSLITLDEFAGTIQTASAAELMLLSPAGSAYRVERVFRREEEIR